MGSVDADDDSSSCAIEFAVEIDDDIGRSDFISRHRMLMPRDDVNDLHSGSMYKMKDRIIRAEGFSIDRRGDDVCICI